MNITVLGHLCYDAVHLPGQEGGSPPERRLGGIAYTIAALAAMTTERDRIVPVVGVGESDRDELLQWMKAYPQVSTDGVFTFKGKTNEVHLFYEGGSDARIECSKHISQPIPFETIRPFLDTRGILINMISGFDITLETLDRIRMETRDKGTPIYFDFHSLTLGIDREYRRFRRALPDWRRWCFMLDTIQMSEEEAAGMTTEHYDENDLVNQLMPLMVRNLLITRGSNGARLIHQEHKKLTRHDFPGIALTPSPDPTGCGDVFGAVFFAKYLETGSGAQAAETANKVAAFHTTYSGSEQLARAAQFLKEHSPAPA
ncbi:MAG TPA: carbohydrate kinase family protein [Bacteroidota bacterium]